MKASTIGGINLLPDADKREIYTRLIPNPLLERLNIPTTFIDSQGISLLDLHCEAGRSDVSMYLYHQAGFPDPVLFGHLADTLNGQMYVLLYVLNDPSSPRFDVDRMPDGSQTKFGTTQRNLPAEQAAMEAGLAPGQVRRGLRMLPTAIATIEEFVQNLGHDMYFGEPLYYHNAIIFERYGFAYQSGRKFMEQIEAGFSTGGELLSRLNNSTPFRKPEAVGSIRMRSWAIHDGILGQPFTNVTMYKRVGKLAGVCTCKICDW